MNNKELPPCCKIDPETGKLVALPMPSFVSSSKKRSFTSNAYTPRSATNEVPHKIRRTESGKHYVRKALFKVPEKQIEKAPVQTSNSHTNSKSRPITKKTKLTLPSLQDANEVEEEEVNSKGYTFGTPKIIVTNFTGTKSITEPVKHDRLKDLVAGVHSLLEENQKEQEKFKIIHELNLSKIDEIIKKDRLEYEKINMLLCSNTTKIYNLLNQIESGSETNIIDQKMPKENLETEKENIVENRRKSLRLSNKSSANNSPDAEVMLATPPSPVQETTNLRKEILKKNHVKSSSAPQDTMFTRAATLYSLTRDACSDKTMLSTPKIDKTLLADSPKNLLWRSDPKKNLSRKLQKQCLMLQDTPVRK